MIVMILSNKTICHDFCLIEQSTQHDLIPAKQVVRMPSSHEDIISPQQPVLSFYLPIFQYIPDISCLNSPSCFK